MIPQRNLQRLNELYEELKANGSLAVDYSCLGSDDPLPSNAVDEGVLTERFSGCLLGGRGGRCPRASSGSQLTWPRVGRELPAMARLEVWTEGYDHRRHAILDVALAVADRQWGVEPRDLVQRFSAKKIRGSATQPERSEERQGFREALV